MRWKFIDEMCALYSGWARDFGAVCREIVLAAFWNIQGILQLLEKPFEGNISDVMMR
jgi:hypothetical protein